MSKNDKSKTVAKPPSISLADRMVKQAPKITLLTREELTSPFTLKALTDAQAKVMTCSSTDPPEVQEASRKRLEEHRKKEKAAYDKANKAKARAATARAKAIAIQQKKLDELNAEAAKEKEELETEEQNAPSVEDRESSDHEEPEKGLDRVVLGDNLSAIDDTVVDYRNWDDGIDEASYSSASSEASVAGTDDIHGSKPTRASVGRAAKAAAKKREEKAKKTWLARKKRYS